MENQSNEPRFIRVIKGQNKTYQITNVFDGIITFGRGYALARILYASLPSDPTRTLRMHVFVKSEHGITVGEERLGIRRFLQYLRYDKNTIVSAYDKDGKMIDITYELVINGNFHFDGNVMKGLKELSKNYDEFAPVE